MTSTMRLHGMTVIDGTGAEPHRGTVVIEGDRIVDARRVGGDADVDLDLGGLTLLPGLVDAHAHPGLPEGVAGAVAGDVSVAEVAGLLFTHTRQMLDAGFTSVRYCGGVDGGLLAAVARGFVAGPKMVTAGPVLCQRGGHGHYAPRYSDGTHPAILSTPGLVELSRVCDGPDEMRRTARDVFRQGASFLKLCVTGGVASYTDEVGDTQFTVEEIRAAVVEAEARGSYVTVHAHNVAGMRNAIAAGVKGIEHGTDLDEETAALMAAAGVDLVPTLTIVHLLATGGMGAMNAWSARLGDTEARMAQAIKIAKAAGVRVGAGSDLVGPVQEHRGLEIALRAAVTDPLEAITTMTSVNAAICRMPDVGSIAPGKAADLIAVHGDPLAEPRLFDDPARIVLVVKDGVIVKDLRRG